MRLTEKEITYRAVTLYEGEVPIACGDIEIIGEEIWLNNFAVREDFRGKGYGQKALQIFIERFSVNTLTCAIQNEVALHIYKKHGFNVVDEGYSFGDGKVYLMKKEKTA